MALNKLNFYEKECKVSHAISRNLGGGWSRYNPAATSQSAHINLIKAKIAKMAFTNNHQ